MPISYLGQYDDNQRIITGFDAIGQQLPNLARGNDVAMLIGGVRSDVGNVGNKVEAIRSDQNTRFSSIDGQLSSISSNVGSGGASSVISLNSTEFIAPLIVNLPWLDLGYLLGSTDTGFTTPGGVAINITANSTESGNSPNVLTSKDTQAWYSTNASGRLLTIDFGFNKTARTIKLTGLGFQSYDVSSGSYPVNLIISGSNNNSSYTTIYTWSSIGFNASFQWKYTAIPNTTAYRYIRITQSGLNSGGNNYFSCGELRFYGSLQNP